jgi:hypothetical protein
MTDADGEDYDPEDDAWLLSTRGGRSAAPPTELDKDMAWLRKARLEAEAKEYRNQRAADGYWVDDTH